MENGQEPATTKTTKTDKLDIDKFVEGMIAHAQELHDVLRKEGDKNDIKDRITCLKYLEEVTKTYFILKKATTHDPDAAGSTVRKYASAFAKDATGVGKTRRGRKPAAFAAIPADTGDDDLEGDGTAA